MKKNKTLAKLLAIMLSTIVLSGTMAFMSACKTDDSSNTDPPSTETPDEPPDETPDETPGEADDGIDWSKEESVTPGYSNVTTYKQVEYFVTSEKSGLKIGGFLNYPNDFDKTKKYPLVIMSHGIAGSVSTYDQSYVPYFLEKDVLCFTYFFCGGGAPDTRNKSRIKSTSEGDSRDMSLLTEKNDLLSVFNDLSKKAFVDTSKIVLMGESMGGAVTGLAAVDISDKIAGEILLYPAVSINEDIIKVYETFDNIPEELNNNGLVLKRDKFYKDIKDIDLVKTVASFPKKACLVHGTVDGTVNIEYSNRLAAQFKDVEYLVVEGGRHGFTNATLKPVIPHIMNYLKDINVITDANIVVGDKSGSWAGNNNPGDPPGSGTGSGVSGTPLETKGEVLFTVKESSVTGNNELILYSDGILKAGSKTGEWRYIDGVLTVGIVGNSIYLSSTDAEGVMTIQPAWFGSIHTFTFAKADLEKALGTNQGLTDRSEWVGEYR